MNILKYYLPIDDLTTKFVYNEQFQPMNMITKDKDNLTLYSISNDPLINIFKKNKALKVYEIESRKQYDRFSIMNTVNHKRAVLFNSKLYISKNKKTMEFKVYQKRKLIAHAEPQLFKDGYLTAIDSNYEGNDILLIAMIEFLSDTGYITDDQLNTISYGI